MLVMAAILPVALAYHPHRPMRLLVITARYPTADRPAAGAFVRDRLDGVEADVIAPRHYRGSGLGRAWSVLWRSVTARGTFDGVECHFVLPTGPIAFLASRLRRLPLVVYAHGGDVREMAARRWILRVLARLVVRRADAVVTNSVQTAAWVTRAEAEPNEIFQLFTRSGIPYSSFKADWGGEAFAVKVSPKVDEYLRKRYESSIQDAHRFQLIRQPFDFGSWVDSSFLDQVLEEQHLAGVWPARPPL